MFTQLCKALYLTPFLRTSIWRRIEYSSFHPPRSKCTLVLTRVQRQLHETGEDGDSKDTSYANKDARTKNGTKQA